MSTHTPCWTPLREDFIHSFVCLLFFSFSSFFFLCVSLHVRSLITHVDVFGKSMIHLLSPFAICNSELKNKQTTNPIHREEARRGVAGVKRGRGDLPSRCERGSLQCREPHYFIELSVLLCP